MVKRNKENGKEEEEDELVVNRNWGEWYTWRGEKRRGEINKWEDRKY